MPRGFRSSNEGQSGGHQPQQHHDSHHPPASHPPASHPPAHHPPAAPAEAAPKQPGLMAQMATTAAGVAVGSTVGALATNAIMGGGSSSEAAPASPQQPAAQLVQPSSPPPPFATQQPAKPCQVEMKQLLDCAMDQTDISLCQAFREAMMECRIRHIPSSPASLPPASLSMEPAALAPPVDEMILE